MPGWYVQLRAADRLHCAPWELDEAPLEWVLRAEEAIRAENEAAEAAMKRATRRKG